MTRRKRLLVISGGLAIIVLLSVLIPNALGVPRIWEQRNPVKVNELSFCFKNGDRIKISEEQETILTNEDEPKLCGTIEGNEPVVLAIYILNRSDNGAYRINPRAASIKPGRFEYPLNGAKQIPPGVYTLIIYHYRNIIMEHHFQVID
jgi:hypothetical protein